MKSISELYFDSYSKLADKQHAKYGNPTAATHPAPNHVPAGLVQAVQAKTITNEQARKLAIALGRAAYGEVGLTSGVVSNLIDKIVGFNKIPWHTKAELESRLCS